MASKKDTSEAVKTEDTTTTSNAAEAEQPTSNGNGSHGTTSPTSPPTTQSPVVEDTETAVGGDEAAAEERTPDYEKLLEYGLDAKVAGRLDEIYKTGKLSHVDLDDRALDALKEFPTDGALAVLAQFLESNLEHVSNKSAYLCGVMKTYRQKTRAGGVAGATSTGTGASTGANGTASGSGAGSVNGSVVAKGPDEEKIKEILDRTGYKLDVTTGQRKYGGPPPDWEGEPPSSGCEVFCGKIPRDYYESELIPLFEKCGTIWDLRLMMDPMTGLNRGYAFVTFTTRDAAQEAVRQLDSYELEEGKCLKVNVSEPKTRLFIGNIPKSKGRDEIDEEFNKLSAGLREVIIYSSPDDKKKNRGFCFLEYESHKAASLAKRRLETGRVKVWSCDIIVDWADPQEEPDDDTMSQVKVLYVRNLTAAVTEDKLKEVFEVHGKVDRVKKIKDYAFVHFEDRHQAEAAMNALNNEELCGSNLEISLAKPPSDKKKKEEILRKREQRMMRAMSHKFTNLNLSLGPPFPFPPAAYGPMPGGNAGGMYRGGGNGGRGGGNNPSGGMRGGGMSHRGFDNHQWHWGAGWGNDASWTHPAQPRGPVATWMGASDAWGHPGGRGGGGGYAWGANGAVAAGNYSGGSQGQHQGGGGRGGRKGYSTR